MTEEMKLMEADPVKERQEKEDKISQEILRYIRILLTMELRFMDVAINRLNPFPLPGQLMMTDGSSLAFDPAALIRAWKKEEKQVVRTYLHTVLHCIFHHVFQASGMDRRLWDLACDMAVEHVICGLDAPSVRTGVEAEQKEVLSGLEKEIHPFTAEKIYRFLRDHPLPAGEEKRLLALFHPDEHHVWYSPSPMQSGEERAGGNQGSRYQVQNEKGKQTEGGSRMSNQTKMEEKEGEEQKEPGRDPAQDWKEIARRMKTDLETIAQKKGRKNGALLQSLTELNRERYDYASFLRRFSVMGEHLRINPDEFDYIFYTYGLKKYGNLPLIEPLEYSEDRHVKEFVIAIDTSGSVKGPLVQAFVQKTYNILKSTESFASRVNVHIIQCDREIREHVKITRLEEFDHYIRSMTLKGFGGTDFRPVFTYVDKLIAEKEFKNLRGLIYFTDGQGEFPRRRPAYETAFVFLEHADNNMRIPPWAIPLILEEEEIRTS